MIIAFDTETTGLPDFKARSSDPSQPHLVHLAMVLCRDDGAEVEAHNVIIKPDGWVIPDEVAQIHGITTAMALERGIPEADAVAMFVVAQAKASLRVAHNESFDRRIMRIAMTRAGMERADIEAIEARPSYCTCINATPIVNLPPTPKMLAAGFTKPKQAKLAECIKHFFDEDLTGAHDALVDVRACARVFFHLRSLQEIAA
jgi:DNA polymerase-3 subunit epsilon